MPLMDTMQTNGYDCGVFLDDSDIGGEWGPNNGDIDGNSGDMGGEWGGDIDGEWLRWWWK